TRSYGDWSSDVCSSDLENALKEKLAARQKLAERLSVAEAELGEKRAAAEKLAVAGAANARLDRAEAAMRAVDDRTKTWRAELARSEERRGGKEGRGEGA